MIAVDTNVLVYAHREDSDWYDKAVKAVTELAEGSTAWAIPWPCIHEFLAIVTHARIFRPPTSVAAALDQVAAWLESPSLVMLAEQDGYLARLRELVESGRVVGPKIHDARVAALCLSHGIRELWTTDRDFSLFPAVRVRNPLVGSESA